MRCTVNVNVNVNPNFGNNSTGGTSAVNVLPTHISSMQNGSTIAVITNNGHTFLAAANGTILLTGLNNVVDIQGDNSANYYACILYANGKVNCGNWGNTTSPSTINPGIDVNISNVTKISLDIYSSKMYALLANGIVKSWDPGAELTPASVPIVNVTDISTNFNHACAVLTDETVWCWGSNDSGQLGDGTTNNSSVPVQATGITSAAKVATSQFGSCALLTNGTINCWGGDNLGNGTSGSSPTPILVSGIDSATKIVNGAFWSTDYACALLSTGNISCWGSNFHGQLGYGTTDSDTPTIVPNVSNVVDISPDFTTVLLNNGVIMFWGTVNVTTTGAGIINGPWY